MDNNIKTMTEEELVSNLNLAIKIVASGAPALANEISATLKQVYAERNEAKQKVAALEARIAALENPATDVEIPVKDTKKSK